MKDDWWDNLDELPMAKDRKVLPESVSYDGPRSPSAETKERVAWLEWLVARFGSAAVARWRQPKVTLEEWRGQGCPVS